MTVGAIAYPLQTDRPNGPSVRMLAAMGDGLVFLRFAIGEYFDRPSN